jgi:hypothetical protein
MTLDVQKLFNEELPTKLARHGSQATKIGAKARIHVTGDGGGVWFIDTSASGPSTSKGYRGGAHLGITITAKDFRKLMENPEGNAMRLYAAGKIKVAGNELLALKLARLLAL